MFSSSRAELVKGRYESLWEFSSSIQSTSTLKSMRSRRDRTHVLPPDGLEHPNPVRKAGFPYRYFLYISKLQIMQCICFSLHIGLILLHVGLLIVCIAHWEHRKVVQLGKETKTWSIALIVLSQAFVTIYTAGMLVLTQQLSLRRNILVYQTLTATHDKSIAWTGLGSALLSLWRQFSITASAMGVTFIMCYLAGIAVLHISTPALLSLEAFNDTIQTNVSSTRALPNLPREIMSTTYEPFVQAAPILPLLGQFSQLSRIGLHGSTVYDVLSDNLGVGPVLVNATIFNVSCYPLSNAVASAGGATLRNITADGVSYRDGNHAFSDFQVSVIAPNVFRLALNGPDGRRIDWNSGNRALFYSSIQFTDSQGVNGSRVALDPPMIPDIQSDTFARDASQIHSLQVMACRCFSHNETLFVDAQTKLLVQPPSEKNESTWGVESGQVLEREFIRPELRTLWDWGEILWRASQRTSTTYTARCELSCEMLPVLDQFLIEHLQVKPDLDPVMSPQARPQLHLHQLENALASMTAALHWSITQVQPGDSTASTLSNMAFAGQATVSRPQLVSRFNLNEVPVAVGLGTSVLLFILAIMLVGNLDGRPVAVDSTGILQLMWLLRDRNDLLTRISQVNTPSVEELRQAGMFLARFAGDDSSNDSDESHHRERPSARARERERLIELRGWNSAI